MKKSTLMARAAAIAMTVPISLPPTPVRADWCDNCSTVWGQAQALATQVQDFAQQIQQMEQDYRMFTGIFQQLQRMVDPNNIATELFDEQNPLPEVGQITSMLQGGVGVGNLGRIAQQFLNADTIYRPGGADFNATQLNNSAASLANVQALATQSLQSIQNHITGLDQLRGQLGSVSSEADLSAIRGRIEAEEADLQAQGVQAQALQTAMLTQQQVEQQEQAQKVRQDDDELLNNTAPIGGGGASVGDGGVPSFPGS
jgi:type IV secretion system protein VirB5